MTKQPEVNGKSKVIWILAGWIFVIVTSIFGVTLKYTWASVTDNRKEITEVKDCINDKLNNVVQRLARIEAKIE